LLVQEDYVTVKWSNNQIRMMTDEDLEKNLLRALVSKNILLQVSDNQLNKYMYI
jgi:hypothetical protein